MTQDVVEIEVEIGNGETTAVNAYLTEDAAGLAIHRALRWDQGSVSGWKYASSWQITHLLSKKALLWPDVEMPSLAHARALVTRLAHIDWSMNSPDVTKEDILEAIALVNQDKSLNEKESDSRRYVVRRNQHGAGYAVIDTSTDQVVETHVHRGIASQAAKDRNKKTSI